MVRDEMAQLLSPRQLGYGVRGGGEAAVHAARRFLAKMAANHAFVKLDLQNAFNSIHRDKMLQATRDLALTSIHLSTPPTPPPHISSGVTDPSFQPRGYSRVTLWGLYCSV